MRYSCGSLGGTACWALRVNGRYGRISTPPAPYCDLRGSIARWLASRKPAETWLDEPSAPTSESTPTSVASLEVSSAQTLATIGPSSVVSLASGALVYVSAEASHVRLSVSHGPDAAPAVHCAVMREHGLEAGSSGARSLDPVAGSVALREPSLIELAEPDFSPVRYIGVYVTPGTGHVVWCSHLVPPTG